MDEFIELVFERIIRLEFVRVRTYVCAKNNISFFKHSNIISSRGEDFRLLAKERLRSESKNRVYAKS